MGQAFPHEFGEEGRDVAPGPFRIHVELLAERRRQLRDGAGAVQPVPEKSGGFVQLVKFLAGRGDDDDLSLDFLRGEGVVASVSFLGPHDFRIAAERPAFNGGLPGRRVFRARAWDQDRIRSMSERELIRWIRSRLHRRGGRIVVDSGDDAAVLRFGRRQILFKTDCVIDGVHFDSATARPEEIGHKALGRCLSDVAAMAAVPSFAVAALMIPRNAREAYVRRVIEGMERTAAAFRTAIVGGDVSSHAGKLAITVALLGETRGGAPVRRSGARLGDVFAVTGPLGGSLLGKHLRFVPRVREALELRRRFDLHAMIDISDGLAVDLEHLCRESGVGAVLEEACIPISAAARRLARKDRRTPLEHALGDGEDYELLFALPAGQSGRLERSGLGRVIGEVAAMEGIYLRRRDGRLEERTATGWEHRWGR